jgi:putative transposase
MVTPDVKRAAVAHACAVHGVSQRRACAALAVDRSTARYVTRRGDDAELRAAIRQVADERDGSAIAASKSCWRVAASP